MMSLERVSASPSSFSPLLAAARPAAIFFCRSSMAPMSHGQKNFMTAQATRKNTTPWMTSLSAKFLAYSLAAVVQAPSALLLEIEGAQQRIGLQQQESDGHAYDRHGGQ